MAAAAESSVNGTGGISDCDKVSEAIDALTVASGQLTDFFANKQEEFDAREKDRTAKFEEELAALEKEFTDQTNDLEACEEELQEERRTFQDEIDSLNDTHKFTKQKIKLDVGGRPFTTSRTTLLTEPNSFLAAMLSGRYELLQDAKDGSYFIDRDGQQFHHILNFLRGPDAFECPTDPAVLEVLLEDAEYYCMSEFQKVVEVELGKARAAAAKTRLVATASTGQYSSVTEATWADANAARTRPRDAPSAGGWNGAAR